MDYFEPLLAGRFASSVSDGLPLLSVPCTRPAFLELLACLDSGGELTGPAEPTDEATARLQETADVLGLSPHLCKSLTRPIGRTRESLDLYSVRPAWWRAASAEALRRRGGGAGAEGAGPSLLLAVDGALARATPYAPVAKVRLQWGR